MASTLSIKHLIKGFNQNETVVNDISFDIEKGVFMTIVGPSGSGKSTLLNLISGLLKPDEGSVFFQGKNIIELKEKELANFRRQEISHIFQEYHLLSHLNVEDNILLGKSPTKENLNLETVTNFLAINDLLSYFPQELSGGQKQRVAIARAVIKKPKILFCDEATGALDEENSKNVISLLHTIQNKTDTTIIFVTHNKEITKTAHRTIRLKDGKVMEDYYNNNIKTVEEISWE